MLRYLARYVFRTAIANNRITGLDGDGVTFRHKHRASNRWRQTQLSGPEFMRRFLQPAWLPKGLHKVRYFGLWHPSRRQEAAQARLLLLLQPEGTGVAAQPSRAGGEGRLIHVRRLNPKQPEGP